ncbi:glycosyltransferase family 9 protein [Christiangramia aquimixticola]|uniref:glycosyltransferase family 9 protein n=1 Tax=Christiangramia aquimixticola TaxID=1697558 RepID=UPI003AA820A5
MKILVIQMKMIGDVLTSSILFEALRKKYPKAQLNYLVYDHTFAVVQNNPFIDRIIFYNKSQRFTTLVRDIRKGKYNVVIDVQSNIKTSLLSAISGAPVRIAYDKFYTRPVSNHVFSRKIEAKTNAGAAIEKRLRLLSPLSAEIPAEIKPKIYLKEEEITAARHILEGYGIDLSKKLFMIGALGSNEKKTYPLAYMAKLLDQIAERTNAQLIFNYIPSQRTEIDELMGFCKPETRNNIHLNVYGTSLRQFLGLVSHCDALIGNEGGAVNMAKALDIPNFAIFSPALDKANWNMYEDGKRYVSVHLKDYKPELFEGKAEKQLKSDWNRLYAEFKPELLENDLNNFLINNS